MLPKRLQHNVPTPVQKCCFSPALAEKETVLCHFSPVDQRGSSGVFFLGTLIAFQFVFFHGVISAAGKNLLAGGYQADIIFLHFNIDVNNIIFQDESLICVSEEKYHSYIQYVYS